MQEQIVHIINAYLAGTATPEEIAFLEAYYDHFDTAPSVDEQHTPDELEQIRAEVKKKIDQEIRQKNS